jgi:hypothetical protein
MAPPSPRICEIVAPASMRRIRLSSGEIKCLPLEEIILVSAAPGHPGPEGGEDIGGNEKWSPEFALADVDSLVGAGNDEKFVIAGEDNMAEGHGGSAAAKDEPDDSAEPEVGRAAADFEYAFLHMGGTAGEENDAGEEQSPHGCGKSPGIDKEAAEFHDSNELVQMR